MLIRLLVGLSGSEYSLGPGDERDFPNDEALRLIAAGYAAPVLGGKIERAVTAPAPEHRLRVRPRKLPNVVSGDGNG